MSLSDAELFDFNAALMEDYDDEKAHADLEEYGDAFRFQLVAALHMDAWVERLQDPDSRASRGMDEIEVRGWITALKNLAAFLRQGYYLPGGSFFEQVVSNR
jgi:hypothetical protein